jgi:transcriptional regulator with XRE-family HTH domain
MVTSRQVRVARALLGWTQELLADKALVALTALKRLESERLLVRDATREAVRKALEAAGIVFLCPTGERASSWSGRRQENRTKRLEQVRTAVEGRRH